MSDDLTALLRRASQGGSTAFQELGPLVYGELRALARHARGSWQNPLGPCTTSLVHDAWLKLSRQPGVEWAHRGHFYAVASHAMRHLLVDNARTAQRQKRGGGAEHVPLDEELVASSACSEEILDIDRALGRLESADARLARIVECRVFGGLTVEETAEALEISAATVKRSWALARAWLYREIAPARG